MENPTGEADDDVLRLDFDRRLKLEFPFQDIDEHRNRVLMEGSLASRLKHSSYGHDLRGIGLWVLDRLPACRFASL